MQNDFPKEERLKSLKAYSLLFSEGDSFKQFPIRMVYSPWRLQTELKIQVGFSVSKRKFKNAVDRNRIKRQMREAYRLQRRLILTNLKQSYAVVFLYIHHENMPYTDIASAMEACLTELSRADEELIRNAD